MDLFKNKFAYIVPYILIIYLFQMLALKPISSIDVHMYFAIAQKIISLKTLPLTDPFIYSINNYNWNIAHAWLSYVFFYSVYSVFGWHALFLTQIVLNFFTVAIPFLLGKLLDISNTTIVFVLSVALMSVQTRFSLRTSVFSDLLIVVTFFISILYISKGTKLIYFYPLIFLLWVNLHPGFIVGIFIIFIPYLIEPSWYKSKASKKYLSICLISCLACFLNPKGASGVLFPLKTLIEDDWGVFKNSNNEWMPIYATEHRYKIGALFLYILSIIGSIHMFYKPNTKRLGYYFTFIVILYFAFTSYRNISWASLVLTLLLYYDTYKNGSVVFKRCKLYFILCIFFIFSFSTYYYYLQTDRLKWVMSGLNPILAPTKYPFGAVKFMKENFINTGIFNDYAFGSFMSYEYPDAKVFIHGFIDDQKFIKDNYIDINESQEKFNQITQKFGIEVFFLSTELLPKSKTFSANEIPLLYSILFTDKNWALVYFDSTSIIFVKNIYKYSYLINKFKVSTGTAK